MRIIYLGPLIASTSVPLRKVPLSKLEPVAQDVVSSLTNLGAQQQAAELAVRRAMNEKGCSDFEPLFRRALELLR